MWLKVAQKSVRLLTVVTHVCECFVGYIYTTNKMKTCVFLRCEKITFFCPRNVHKAAPPNRACGIQGGPTSISPALLEVFDVCLQEFTCFQFVQTKVVRQIACALLDFIK